MILLRSSVTDKFHIESDDCDKFHVDLSNRVPDKFHVDLLQWD